MTLPRAFIRVMSQRAFTSSLIDSATRSVGESREPASLCCCCCCSCSLTADCAATAPSAMQKVDANVAQVRKAEDTDKWKFGTGTGSFRAEWSHRLHITYRPAAGIRTCADLTGSAGPRIERRARECDRGLLLLVDHADSENAVATQWPWTSPAFVRESVLLRVHMPMAMRECRWRYALPKMRRQLTRCRRWAGASGVIAATRSSRPVLREMLARRHLGAMREWRACLPEYTCRPAP